MKILLEDLTAEGVKYEVPSQAVVSVGRHRSNDIVIPNRDYRNSLNDDIKDPIFDKIALTVSASHCTIYQDKGKTPYIVDNHSMNGTSLGGVPLTDERRGNLDKDGAILSLGNYQLRVRVIE